MVCASGEENRDEKTTYIPSIPSPPYSVRALSRRRRRPPTVSGISLFIFLARVISLMYAKQRARGISDGRVGRADDEEFLLKNRRSRVGSEEEKPEIGPVMGVRRGGRLQLLCPFFNGKVVLMNKSLFSYNIYTYKRVYIYMYIFIISNVYIYIRKRGERAIVCCYFTFSSLRIPIPPHPSDHSLLPAVVISHPSVLTPLPPPGCLAFVSLSVFTFGDLLDCQPG